MKYSTAPAFRRALEDRLKVRAGGDGARIARDRKRVVFDRFLARLVEVAAGEWVLREGSRSTYGWKTGHDPPRTST